MDFRHLRYFIAVAEELHFGRAANRLHIESSPLSRAIKELEEELGVRLFDRDTRKTTITTAGVLFLDEARRVLATVEQACTRVRAVARGICGTLRIGFCDGLAQPRLAELIAQFRQDEPNIDVRIVEMPFNEQVKQLRSGLLDLGLALTEVVGEGVVAEPLWRDPVVVVLPAKHPFTRRRTVALADLAEQPLILCHPDCGSGCHGQIDNILRRVIRQPRIADYAASAAAGITLVASGYGVALMGTAEAALFQRPDITVRPLSEQRAALTTFMLRAQTEPSGAVRRFIGRLHSMGNQSSEGQD